MWNQRLAQGHTESLCQSWELHPGPLHSRLVPQPLGHPSTPCQCPAVAGHIAPLTCVNYVAGKASYSRLRQQQLELPVLTWIQGLRPALAGQTEPSPSSLEVWSPSTSYSSAEIIWLLEEDPPSPSQASAHPHRTSLLNVCLHLLSVFCVQRAGRRALTLVGNIWVTHAGLDPQVYLSYTQGTWPSRQWLQVAFCLLSSLLVLGCYNLLWSRIAELRTCPSIFQYVSRMSRTLWATGIELATLVLCHPPSPYTKGDSQWPTKIFRHKGPTVYFQSV